MISDGIIYPRLLGTYITVTTVGLKLNHPRGREGGGGRCLILFFILSSSWVKIRMHTENQLPRLPGSALKVPVIVVGRTQYQVKHQPMLRLSWSMTIFSLNICLCVRQVNNSLLFH